MCAHLCPACAKTLRNVTIIINAMHMRARAIANVNICTVCACIYMHALQWFYIKPINICIARIHVHLFFCKPNMYVYAYSQLQDLEAANGKIKDYKHIELPQIKEDIYATSNLSSL
jgi:hypothetical protein